MSYVPPSFLLHGVPYPVAECYGKPHFLCDYRSENVRDTRLSEDARCMCCGKPATNAHHWPPRRTAPTFGIYGHKLKPALFAVCGTGTTGCHDGWHGGARYRALWRWDSEDMAREWWEGELIATIGPHSMALYGLGYWEIYDMVDGKIRKVRL